jgi:glycine/D-amino acid oxidase-like deaminating enzyme
MDRLFHPSFQPKPYWWDAYAPQAGPLAELPRTARVAIVGGGYAGLATALELSKLGIDAVVLEGEVPGFGASTRNCGVVASYSNLAHRYGKGGGATDREAERRRHAEAIESASLVGRLIREEGIDCHWTEPGHFVAAWSKGHFQAMAAKVAHLNDCGDWGAALVPRERMREELGSDFYRGGMTIARSALLHPALYYRGLLAACARRGIPICAQAKVTSLRQDGGKWRVGTARGEIEAGDVVIATNGYTGALTPQFRRRLVPLGSFMIATEELAPDVVAGLIPKGRAITDTRRVLVYARPSPDGRRLLFGGRVRFSLSDPLQIAPHLHRMMLEWFPALEGLRITHAWTGTVAFTFDEGSHMGRMDGLYYALGCNGAGVAMMTHLGTQTARKIAGVSGARSNFDDQAFPTHPLYRGDPWFVPAVGSYYRFRDWLDRRRDR